MLRRSAAMPRSPYRSPIFRRLREEAEPQKIFHSNSQMRELQIICFSCKSSDYGPANQSTFSDLRLHCPQEHSPYAYLELILFEMNLKLKYFTCPLPFPNLRHWTDSGENILNENEKMKKCAQQRVKMGNTYFREVTSIDQHGPHAQLLVDGWSQAGAVVLAHYGFDLLNGLERQGSVSRIHY